LRRDSIDPNKDETADQPVINVAGERVALGPLSRELLSSYRAWMNDVVTQGWAGFPIRPEPFTDERMAVWYERAATDQERMYFTVYESSAWRAIGLCALRDIDLQHRTAEFGLAIGNRADRGKGYGTEAVMLLLDVAFTGLGLNNVQIEVFEFNHAGLRAYQKAGFKEIGRRRRAYFMGGRFWDVVYMDCLADEFNSPVLSRLLDPDNVC
jgi:RimJ/RimL family protein N-acetyltransferase